MSFEGKIWLLCVINNLSMTGPTNACFILVQLSACPFVYECYHSFDLENKTFG